MKVIIVGVAFLFVSSGWAAPLLLKSGVINPSTSGTTVRGTRSSAVAASRASAESSKYIIQHDGRITSEWRKALRSSGAEILRYVPENAYLISVTSNALDYIQNHVAYSQLLPYAKQFRVAPETARVLAQSSLSNALSDASTNAASTARYSIALFSDKVRTTYTEQIAALAGCRVLRADGRVIRAELTPAGLDAVSEWDEVEFVDAWVEPKLHNNIAVQAPRMNIETVWPSGSTGLGLTGAGQVVAVADTGLDTGSTATLHADVRGRVTRTYALGRSNDWSDPDGHGTHVVGSVLGNGASSSNPKIRGAAYGASLIFQSVMDSSGYLTGLPSDLRTLFEQAYDEEDGVSGARIHSDSWGASVAGEYTDDSQGVDDFIFTHPQMLAFFSAGNEGVDTASPYGVIDPQSIGSPATAKNCVTVGAAENARTSGGYSTMAWGKGWPSDYGYAPINSDLVSQSADGEHQGMAAFSSRGPCQDGRIKPDIVAPGTDILSLHSSANGASTMWGSYSANSKYCYSGGTSMSCPLTAGAAALAREWLVTYAGIANPDGATLKALLLAGAKSLTPGQYGTGDTQEIPADYPNNVEGWGQVNIGNAVANAQGVVVYDAQIIQDGATQEQLVRVATAGQPLAIVMAYADAPAALTASKQLVDDLDLKVVSPSGTVYYPNSLSAADHINNVEGVRIASAEAGVYTITVEGTDINTGMDTALTGGKEDAIRYSLVVNGAKRDGVEECLSSIAISGPEQILGGEQAEYACKAIYTYGTVQVVTPTWAITAGGDYATVDAQGCVTTTDVDTLQMVTLSATFTEGDVTKTATFEIEVSPPSDEFRTALDNANLIFTTGGDASWFAQADTTHDGVDALQSGALSDKQSSWVETDVVGPGKLSFWWCVSSEAGYDKFSFLIDETQQDAISGTGGTWAQCTYEIPAGTHTLRWSYAKDGSVSKGSDAGFLDQVVWEGPFEFPYRLVKGYAVITNYLGGAADVTFPATVEGHPVREIAPNAFRNRDYPFVNVTIAEGISKVGYGAFAGCSRLATLTLPSTVTSIGNDGFAFYDCPQLARIEVAADNAAYQSRDGVLYDKNGATLIYFPANKDPDGAFVVPADVTSIASWAFNGSALKMINIPSGVATMGADALYATALTNLTLRGVLDATFAADQWGSYLDNDCIWVTAENRAYWEEVLGEGLNILTLPDVGELVPVADDQGGTAYQMTLLSSDKTFTVDADWFARSGVDTTGGITAGLMNACGANGIPRYQSFLFNLAPESSVPAEEQLTTTITFDANGTPIVSCTPKGSSNLITYTTLGKATLSDTQWVEMTDANRATLQFFRVRVGIK